MSAPVEAACCYFSAKNADILQPAQKAFLTWDPVEKVETFTVQPKFEGNALDFGMVIPTPSQPKLHEMPRDFFKHLAVYSIMKKREFPHSRLLPPPILAPLPPVWVGGREPLRSLYARLLARRHPAPIVALDAGAAECASALGALAVARRHAARQGDRPPITG